MELSIIKMIIIRVVLLLVRGSIVWKVDVYLCFCFLFYVGFFFVFVRFFFGLLGFEFYGRLL